MTKVNSLRSQFKATQIKSLKKVVEDDDAMVGGGNNEFLQLEDGKTVKIRIFPAHPGVDNFYVKRMCYWLPFTGQDGKPYRNTILDSIEHGGTDMDLVREYVAFAKKKYAKDAEKLTALTKGGMDSDALLPQFTWMCYADKVHEDEELRAKVWEFKKMVRDAINKLAFSEDEDEPIEIDPFTDPDEGLPIMVKYLKNPNKKKGENYYDVNFAKKPVARPLTDEELEYFSKLKPINEVIQPYNIQTYERALEGLQNWDEEHEFGLFEDDEFLEIVEKVKAQYDSDEEQPKRKTSKKITNKVVEDDDDEDEEEEVKKPAKKSKKIEEPEEEPEEETEEEDETESESEDTDEGDEFDDMDRNELKKYIKDNSLNITVKKSMTDDDLRNAIRAEVDEDGEDEEPEEETEEEEKPKQKLTLDAIKAKLAGKKK